LDVKSQHLAFFHKIFQITKIVIDVFFFDIVFFHFLIVTKSVHLRRFLAAGGSLDPVSLVRLAGFDITTDGPLNATIAYIGSLIDEICALTEELDGIRL
jgi:hypothetical protein